MDSSCCKCNPLPHYVLFQAGERRQASWESCLDVVELCVCVCACVCVYTSDEPGFARVSCGNAASFGLDVKSMSSLCNTPNMDSKYPDITEEESL